MSVRVVPSPQALEMLRERIESMDDISAIDAAASPFEAFPQLLRKLM
jgi:hypothetical protein